MELAGKNRDGNSRAACALEMMLSEVRPDFDPDTLERLISVLEKAWAYVWVWSSDTHPPGGRIESEHLGNQIAENRDEPIDYGPMGLSVIA